MLSNKTKRNVWLTLTLLSAVAIADRAFRVAVGEIEWWQLISTIIIACFCLKFYICYRRQVKRGIIFGKVRPFI